MKIKIFGSILLVICFIVAISGCTSNNSTTNTTTNTTVATTNAHGVFENKFVKFNYTKNFVVVDNSTASIPEIYIFSGTPTTGGNLDPKNIGDISKVDANYMKAVTDSTKAVNLNRTKATEWKDSVVGAYSLFIPSKAYLFEMDTNQTTAYNTIKNSLIIK